jgi:hypothetical protein
MSDTCIIAATGPSLTRAVAEQCRNHRVIAVNDSWRFFPHAVAVHSNDYSWWRAHHHELRNLGVRKTTCAGDHNSVEDLRDFAEWGVEAVALEHGNSSTFGAVSLALKLGFTRLALVGCDFRTVGGKRHFFGDHVGLRNTDEWGFALEDFRRLAKKMPPGVSIVNATPGSALTCFPFSTLENL